MRRFDCEIRLAAGTVVLALFAAACVPIFSDGEFQTLKMAFKLDQAVAPNEEKPLQIVIFPEAVKVGKRWVQLSGRLTSPGSGKLPKQIQVEATIQKLQGGQTVQTIKYKLKVADDGTFKANKKVKKNLAANDMMTVTVKPSGGPIAKNTEITLCVDLVQNKGDVDSLPICVEGNPDSGGGNSNQVSFSSIQNDIFTPTCAVSGCHSSGSASGGLVLASGQSHGNLVNVPSTGMPSFDRVEPGNPNSSYLVKKLRGDGDISGVRMPPSRPPLPNDQINQIVQWIEDGAPNN